MTRDKTLSFIMKWHRRIGLALILAIIVLVVTGILINHTADLRLSKININHPLMLKWYGIEHSVTGNSFEVLADTWLINNGTKLLLNDEIIGDCTTLFSAIAYQDNLLALCQNKLSLFTLDGQLIEAISTDFGLPNDSQQLAMVDQKLLIGTSQDTVIFDLESLTSITYPQTVNWPAPTSVPKALLSNIYQQSTGISLETLLLDIHSGRVLGYFGVILMDIAALLLLVLALSGLWAWLRYNKEKPKN